MIFIHKIFGYLLPARRIRKCSHCYSNVAVWLAVCHTPVLYQNG